MTSRTAAIVLFVAAGSLASRADASISVSPTTSYDGSYTVSWTDTSGGTVRAYLNESLNGGAWSKTTVTGTTSKEFSGKPVGTYSYKLQIYVYDSELRKELFEYETNISSVLVTVPAAPGVPGAITGPSNSTAGVYALSWTPASGTVTRYELQENGALIQSGIALSSSFTGKRANTYTYRVRACNDVGCGNFTPDFRVTVESNLTTTLPNDAFVQPTVPDQQWVGAVPGTASTDGGAAQYHIPIEVPPGRAGMQPSIALSYASRSGNGVAGVGWSLAGSSSIYRCPRTLAQEGGNAPVRIVGADRLCMDGKRLVQPGGDSTSYGLNGSEYRTEVDEFARVTLKGGDVISQASYFDVEEKSGTISRYVMKASTLMTWLRVAEFDRQNNCVSYEYQIFNARGGIDQEWVLSRISYTGTWTGSACTTGSDARSVELNYTSDRPDKRTTYLAGRATMMTARLAAIVTKVGGQAVRRWELGYTESAATHRSLLSSVKLCAGATCGVEQLPPTAFFYQGAAPDFAPANPDNAQVRWPDDVPAFPDGTPRAGTPLGRDSQASLVADYDGDGSRDTLVQDPQANRTLLLSGGGLAPSLKTIYPAPWTTVQDPGADADLDGDGRSDLLGYNPDTHKLTVVSLSHGAWESTNTNIDLDAASPTTGSMAWSGDSDGDGLADIHISDGVTNQITRYRRTCIERLDCFVESFVVSAPPNPSFPYLEQMKRDLNGDGTLDNFWDVQGALGATTAVPQIRFQTSPGVVVQWGLDALGGPANSSSDPYNASFSNAENAGRRWLDVNGDGLPDIYDPRDSKVYINRGGTPRAGMFVAVALAPPAPSTAPAARNAGALAFTMDVDADGQEEVMFPTVRTRNYCGGDPLRSQPNGDPMWWCGGEFDAGPADDSFDRSVFAWDAFKLRERTDGSFETIRVATTLQAPVRMAVAPGDWSGNVLPDHKGGDGLQDASFVLVDSWGTTSWGKVIRLGYYVGLASDQYGSYVVRNLGVAPDLLIAATNGMGATAWWTHQPLSRAEVPQGCDQSHGLFYSVNHDADSTPGHAFFTSSMWTASKMEVSNGVGSTNVTCYRYEDAMLDVLGRGFQGFKKITAEERLPPAAGEIGGIPGTCGAEGLCSANNLVTTTEFNQEFPLTNRVKKVTVVRAQDRSAGAAPLSETTYSWNAIATTAPAVLPPARPGVWVVHPTVTVEKKYDLADAGGALLSTTTSVTEVDLTSGEADRVCSVLEDPTAPIDRRWVLSWEDRRPLYNDTTAWWLGRVDRRETVKDFRPTSFTPGSPPTCPAPPRSAAAKIQLVNNGWYADNATEGIGYRRKLKSEQLVARDVTERTTTYAAYDGFGNLKTRQVEARDVPGVLATSLAYTPAPDDGYFVATETNPVGHVARAVTDAATGQPRAHQAVQNGPWTWSDYDALGRLLTVTADGSPPASHRVTGCSGCGDAVMTRQVIQAGSPKQVEYLDMLGRVIATEKEGLANNPVILTQVRFNERGVKVAESPPRFAAYTPWNDAAPPPNLTTYSSIDALGRPGRKTVDREARILAAGMGEPALITTYTYSGFVIDISVNRPAAAGGTLSMSRTTDARGKLVQTKQTVASPAHDILTGYRYDPAGNLEDIEDSEHNHLVAAYDDLDRKTQVTDPDRGVWNYQWDGLGRVLTQTDARGVLITQEYDGIGRPTVRTTTAAGNGTTITDAIWTYDLDGKFGVLSRVEGTAGGTTGDFIRTFAYDDLVRPFRVTTTVGARDQVILNGSRTFILEYGYDQVFGRQKAIRYPALTGSGQIVALDYAPTTLDYGGGDLVGETEIKADLTRGKQYRRASRLSPRGAVLEQDLGNCGKELADYEASSGVATFLSAFRSPTGCSPTELVRQVDYKYDHLLNLSTQTKDAPSFESAETFAYDDLQRLVGASRTWSTPAGFHAPESVTYTYDDLGNITSKSDYSLSYAYAGTRPHAVTSVVGVGSFDYDPNGNMISGAGRTVDFDLMDRAVRVTQAGTATEFAYAPDGARYRQKIAGSPGPVDAKYGAKTVYYVDKAYELAVWSDGGTEERAYVGGTVVLYRAGAGAWEDRYQHLDRLGSVDAVTNGTGGLVTLDLHGYDAFGKPRSEQWVSSQDRLHPSGDRGATTDRGFTGHEHLDVHYLIHMNGRVYDYRLGRFLSVDPVISEAGSQALNAYSYIGNNPLSGVDPTGYAKQEKTAGDSGPGDVAQRTFTGTRIAGRLTVGNLTLGGTDAGVAFNQWAAQVSGATPQGQRTSDTTPSQQGGPPDVGRKDGNSLSLGNWASKLKDPSDGSRVIDPTFGRPSRPPDADVESNVRMAAQVRQETPLVDRNGLHLENVVLRLAWFYAMVRGHGPWDYKQEGSQYEDFGNYHYGLVGRAAGIPEAILLRAAGFAQISAKTSDPAWQSAPWLGRRQPFMPWPWGRTPFGDDPNDQERIKQGSADWDLYDSRSRQ